MPGPFSQRNLVPFPRRRYSTNGRLRPIQSRFVSLPASIHSNMLLTLNLDGLKSNCPARGVRYQPKRAHVPQPTTTTTFTTTHAPKPTEPGIPFNGIGNLKVSTQGQGRGCIISHGTWFSSGTCATFKAEKVRGLYSLSKYKYIHKPHESNQFYYLQRTHSP